MTHCGSAAASIPMALRTKTWTEPLVLKLMARHGERRAEEILERHADQLRREAKQGALPINVDLIASVSGIKRREHPADFAGRIYAEPGGQLVMDLNSADSPERRRFTCAHELMHLAFPGFKRETRYRVEAKLPGQHQPNDEEEYLCDHGAAALLMPASMVKGHYQIADGLSAMEELASDAEVSLQAAGNRLVALADGDAAFLVFAWMHKPADRPALRRGEDVPKGLRLRYATVGGVHTFLPRFKGAPEDTVFLRAWHGRRRHRGREFLPGAERAGAYVVEAKAYGADERRVVLAIAHR
jgi:hypothetical protein